LFTIDPKLRGLPVTREQVVALYQSINQPHLGVPGKKAGPAEAYVLGVRGGGGFAVYVYLYLTDSNDCAVYVSNQRAATPDDYRAQEQEAQAFLESMGFFIDNLNFRNQSPDAQEKMIRELPLFQREPKAGGIGAAKEKEKESPIIALGKLLSSF
jgi:hypothetical protein